jgi:hypothetical protein
MIKRAIHVERTGQSLPIYPEHTKTAIIGQYATTTGIGKDMSETRGFVIGLARPVERVISRDLGNKRAYARRDDQGDGKGLPFHVGQIAQQFAIERFHQDGSAGVTLCGFCSTATICPLARRMMRSAMPEIAALWVMTMAVVPSS